MKKEVRGVIFTLAGGCLWGLSGSCGQYLFTNYQVNSSWLTVVRMLVAGVSLVLFALLRQRDKAIGIWKVKGDAVQQVVFALGGLMFCQYAYLTAISYSNAATATVLQYLGPVLIMLLVCAVAPPTAKSSGRSGSHSGGARYLSPCNAWKYCDDGALRAGLYMGHAGGSQPDVLHAPAGSDYSEVGQYCGDRLWDADRRHCAGTSRAGLENSGITGLERLACRWRGSGARYAGCIHDVSAGRCGCRAGACEHALKHRAGLCNVMLCILAAYQFSADRSCGISLHSGDHFPAGEEERGAGADHARQIKEKYGVDCLAQLRRGLAWLG